MDPARKTQLAWTLPAAACLVAAGLVQEPRRTRTDLWEIVPGRAFIVNYLWIRADRLKDEGRYYDAMQQAELICRLQRRFPGVWSFCSWNMAWNISVATHTPQERWRWVHNGLRLLRDEGIPLNRQSLLLYKDMGWIFFFKIGGYLDDMHWAYKRQWAARMQDLLGAPPEGTTAETIAAFEPVADEALLDKDLDRQGRDPVQADKLAELLREPAVRAYADLLGAAGVPTDQRFLGVYNQYSLDEAVRVVRVAPPVLDRDRAHRLSELINHPAHAEARRRLLAFLRAQVLWNVYRMDPAWMLQMMRRYGPLDWRLPQPHGLYWLTYGLHVSGNRRVSGIDALNTARNVFNCLKDLTWRGRLTMTDLRPRASTEDVLSMEPVRSESDMQLADVRLDQHYDLRFVETTQAEYLRIIHAMTGGDVRRFKNNKLRNGHINYMANCIAMLYAGYRRSEAQQRLDWVRRSYQPTGPEWVLTSVEDFVLWNLRRENRPTRGQIESQMGISIAVALVALGRGDAETASSSLAFARKAHAVFQKDRTERDRLRAFGGYVRAIAARLLVHPRSAGYNLALVDRSQLYKALDAAVQRDIYDRVAPALKSQCQAEGLDFDKAFPAPRKARTTRQPQTGLIQSMEPANP